MTSADVAAVIAGADAAFSGRVGVWAHNLHSGEVVAHRAQETFETASAIKTLIMATALRLVALGRAGLDEPLVVQPRHHVLGSGILRELTPGTSLTLRDTMVLMIVLSDNVATNMVIDRCGGVDAVNGEAGRLRLSRTRLLARLDFESDANAAGFGRSSPEDLGMLYVALHRGECVGPAEDALMRDILFRQQSNTLLSRGLPYDWVAPPHTVGQLPPLRIASKSGAWEGARCDAGIFYGPQAAYVLAVMSGECADPRFHLDNEAMVALPAISRAVWDLWAGGEAVGGEGGAGAEGPAGPADAGGERGGTGDPSRCRSRSGTNRTVRPAGRRERPRW